MNKNIKSLRENIISALPLKMAKKYEMLNRELNTNEEEYYYKKFKPIFDKVFGKDDKGRLIYRKYINIDNIPLDEEIYSFLKQNGYSISTDEFNAGVIIKNKDDKNNKYSLEELQKKGQVLKIGRILNKKKAPQRLLLKWDKISKQISNKKLIVISRHPYDIAGQSTDRSWESCMTLETDKQEKGCNSRYVDSGIKAGVLIAYLINTNDKNINKPLARVLIKPYTNSKEVQFKVSKVYGVAGNEFKNTVQKWVNKNLNTKHIEVYEDMRDYYLNLDTENIYNDSDYVEYDDFEYFATKEEIINIMKELSNDKMQYEFDEAGTIYTNSSYCYYLDFNVYKYVSVDTILDILNLQSSKIDVYVNNLQHWYVEVYEKIDFSLYDKNINKDDLSYSEIYRILEETLENYINGNNLYENCDEFTKHILDFIIDSYVLDHSNRDNDDYVEILKDSIDIDLDYSNELRLDYIDVYTGNKENTYCISASVRIVGRYNTAYDEYSENFFKYEEYGNYSDSAFDCVSDVADTEYDYTYDL